MSPLWLNGPLGCSITACGLREVSASGLSASLAGVTRSIMVTPCCNWHRCADCLPADIRQMRNILIPGYKRRGGGRRAPLASGDNSGEGSTTASDGRRRAALQAMGDVDQPVQQLGWQAALLTSALQAMGDVDQPDQQLGWQAALLTSPAERVPRTDPANDRAKVTASLWHYKQLRVSLRAQLEADPADEDLASELRYVDTQVSVKEDKLRELKSLSELINAKVCFIDEQKTAI